MRRHPWTSPEPLDDPDRSGRSRLSAIINNLSIQHQAIDRPAAQGCCWIAINTSPINRNIEATPPAITIISYRSGFRTIAPGCCNVRCYNTHRKAVVYSAWWHTSQRWSEGSQEPHGKSDIEHHEHAQHRSIDQADSVKGHRLTFAGREPSYIDPGQVR
jgi:hypothetical protein